MWRSRFEKENSRVRIYRLLSLLSTVLLGMLFVIYSILSSRHEKEYFTDDFKQYGIWDGHIELEREDMESALAVFPKEINNQNEAAYYYYCGKRSFTDNVYIIFGEMKYSSEAYESEKERLSKIECRIKSGNDEEIVCNKIQYTEDLFAYPAYVAIYGSNLSYEYALLDEEEQRIIYVFAKLKDLNGILPDEYLPVEMVGQDMYEKNRWENINIYYAKNENGDYVFYDNNKVVINLD